MQGYPEEMQYIYKKYKVNQAERIWKSKYKTKIIQLKKLKDKYKEMEKGNKDVERKYAIMKEVYDQTEILSEQTKTKLKNHHQEKETSEVVIKALRSMTKTKIDSVHDKQLQIKHLQTSAEKEKKTSGKSAPRKLSKTNRNKYNQSETNHNKTKLWK